MFHYPPVVENLKYREAYCTTTLLLHKPGTNPGNVTEGFADAEAALLDFVMNDERCPKIVKDEHIRSLGMTEDDVEDLMVNVEDLVPPQGSQRMQEDQDDWMMGLGDPIRVPDINDPEPVVDDGDDENIDTEWDREADWTSDAWLQFLQFFLYLGSGCIGFQTLFVLKPRDPASRFEYYESYILSRKKMTKFGHLPQKWSKKRHFAEKSELMV